MTAETLGSLLVVEDDPDVAEMLETYFRGLGYDLRTAGSGGAAIRAVQERHPDLVILDIRLPDFDGYEVAQRLRSNRRTEDIPIIFLTERRTRPDRIQGLKVGGDDYITKPFDIQELRLRVRNVLRRAEPGSVTHPVTGMAENALVEERMRECLQTKGWAMILVSLQEFDEFRSHYGFMVADDVLKAAGLIVNNATRELGKPSDFVGQLQDSQFVLVSNSQVISDLKDRLRTRLNQAVEFFYPTGERENPAVPIKILVGQLTANEGPFEDLAGLKAALVKQLM